VQNSTPRFPSPECRFSKLTPAVYYLTGALILTLAVRFYLFKNYYTINNDGILYIEAARNFWDGNWTGGLGSFYPPLFPLLIAAAYPLTGEWELAGQFWPLFLGVLVLFPLFGLIHRLYGQKVALAALFFYAVSPYLARLSLHVRSEIPYIFFLVLGLYFLQRGIDRGNPLYILVMGISIALATMIRSEGVGLVIFGALYLVYRGWVKGGLRRRWLQLGILLFGFVLFSAPYVLFLKWDTGNWLISRKAGLVVAVGLSEVDSSTGKFTMKDSDQLSVVRLIMARPFAYARKVFIDSFRSVGVYFEAVHYSYLLFLFIGWFYFFHGRFWEKEDFFLIALIIFYLGVFALIYVNRRYAVALVPLSLGWVSAGYLAFNEYVQRRWGKRGYFIAGAVVAIFLSGTLPKTLKAIGQEKLYLRQAGLYLKGKPGNPTILTSNGRVGFYAEGQNRLVLKDFSDTTGLESVLDGDYLALDEWVVARTDGGLGGHGWLLDREFSEGSREKLFVFRRQGVQ
jgi:4-amino-4-deoxy-L-arabinose transferase-like glycosyltransferase